MEHPLALNETVEQFPHPFNLSHHSIGDIRMTGVGQLDEGKGKDSYVTRERETLTPEALMVIFEWAQIQLFKNSHLFVISEVNGLIFQPIHLSNPTGEKTL